MLDIVGNFVDAMQKRLGPAETFRYVCGFMTAYLDLFCLPVVARESLELAKRFQRSEASTAQLEHARIQCWEFLDSKSASADFSESETCAIRAAICFLYAESPSEDISELLAWFLTLVEKMNVDKAVVDAACFLKTYFPDERGNHPEN
ncbi:hypothetical protein [Undibacterium luofuense]|uniref:Uncharacterized protein n=1 Tax=Undibacterium luofuense TaxID=2828733 RepID=A0A941I7M9_9BURK|nr:hypothetical protein [Undibacterium luofuense]MBR7784001.1 hypothetical protein [Undibacterium luofuense]